MVLLFPAFFKLTLHAEVYTAPTVSKCHQKPAREKEGVIVGAERNKSCLLFSANIT